MAEQGNTGVSGEGATGGNAGAVDPKVAAGASDAAASAQAGQGSPEVKTVLGEGVKDPAASAAAAAAAPPTWPTDWRQQMAKEAGGNEADQAKELKRLERFASPADVYKSNRELETKMSNGEFKKPLAKDATPEQIREWRTQNGIPESADKYDIKMADGMVIGSADKPHVDKFLKSLHEQNGTNEQASAALNTYFALRTEMAAAQLLGYEKARDETQATLTKEWGGEYQKNLNIIQGLIDGFPETSRKDLLQGIGADGRPLMSNPDIMRGLVALARQSNPGAGLSLPGGTAIDIKSVEARHTELKKMMGQDGSAYWQGTEAAKLQAEFREIDTALNAMKKKAA